MQCSQTPASGRRPSSSYLEAPSTVPKVFLSNTRGIKAFQIANKLVQCFQTLLMNESIFRNFAKVQTSLLIFLLNRLTFSLAQ